jgi:hypothetical protein
MTKNGRKKFTGVKLFYIFFGSEIAQRTHKLQEKPSALK